MLTTHATTQLPTDPPADAIRVRAVDGGDAPALARFYAGLSPESRYRRFLTASLGSLADGPRQLCTPDHVHSEGIVAVLDVPGPEAEQVVGHVCLLRSDGAQLELAVAVADAFRNRGVGRRMFIAALAWAREHGARTITATAFADNGPVLRLLESAPEGALLRVGPGDLVTVQIPLSATPEPERNVP